MYYKLIPIKSIFTEYYETFKTVQFHTGNKNEGLLVFIAFTDSTKSKVYEVEVHASYKNINAREYIYEKDIVDQLIHAIQNNNIYLQEVDQNSLENQKHSKDWLSKVLIFFIGKKAFEDGINDNLFIVGIDCTQAEIDKMTGLVRLEFNFDAEGDESIDNKVKVE
jgi:hypothetical protein